MKRILMVLFCFAGLSLVAQKEGEKAIASAPDKNKELLVVETACGECKFGLTGNSCDLAVRIDGKSYFVDGTDIHSHGDAHAKDGFCNAIRKAEVQGEVVDGRFKATYFHLMPASSKKKK